MKVTAGVLLYRICADGLELLLVSNGKSWSLPKGTVNLKESAISAAKRELLEETKLKAPDDLINLGHVISNEKPEKLHCFIAEYRKKKMPVASKEIKECGFFPLNVAFKIIAAYQKPLLECLTAIEAIEQVA